MTEPYSIEIEGKDYSIPELTASYCYTKWQLGEADKRIKELETEMAAQKLAFIETIKIMKGALK